MNDITRQIAGERGDLAAMLADLPGDRWDAATLCATWRVREVVAHMTMPYRISEADFMAAMAEAGGDFDRMADTAAKRDAAALSAGELAATLKANVDHPWQPPGGGLAGALSHDVIHGLDITVALGIGRRVPEDRLWAVLGSMADHNVDYFGVDLDGIQLRADDLDWTRGSGTPLSGAAQDLLLVVCGRSLPPGHLHGEPSARFTAG